MHLQDEDDSRQQSRMPAEIIHTTTHMQKGGQNAEYTGSFQTRIKARSTGVGEDLELNAKYFATLPGILKLIQIIIAVICMICIAPPLTWFSRLFTFVIATAFGITVLLVFSYLVSLKNVIMPKINWLFVELIYTSAVALLYIITAILQLAYTARSDYAYSLSHNNYYYSFYGGYITAGVFGLLNFFAYGGGAYLLAMEWKDTRKPTVVVPA